MSDLEEMNGAEVEELTRQLLAGEMELDPNLAPARERTRVLLTAAKIKQLERRVAALEGLVVSLGGLCWELAGTEWGRVAVSTIEKAQRGDAGDSGRVLGYMGDVTGPGCDPDVRG